MSDGYRIELYVAGETEEAIVLRDTLLEAFEEAGKAATVTIVDVLAVPEKALEKDIFATPTLMRVFPAPVIKVIANAAKVNKAVLAIALDDD